ncbi:cell division cycle 25 isoform X1 [Bombyx mori]|uniref:protein-tyrosine-phosphatase n=1 Tax=Bombyx mori TaxID=7091 RepID=A0A8R2DJM8_BOMMO|nr:cell division cycle 25 isoform X1 [Bombyx mori]
MNIQIDLFQSIPVSRLITENFRINSGNNATKRKQEEAFSHNYKKKMYPHSLSFDQSPGPSKRRILSDIQNSILSSPINYKPTSPLIERLKSPETRNSPLKTMTNSPKSQRLTLTPKTSQETPKIRHTPVTPKVRSPLSYEIAENILDRPSPLTSRSLRGTLKIKEVLEDRSWYKRSNKENCEPMMAETFMKFDNEEDARDCSFGGSFNNSGETSWGNAKLDFTNLQSSFQTEIKDTFVPQKDAEPVEELDILQDLEQEFDSDNFDTCTKYEIISTDSPDIISRGRVSSARKVTARNFVFGAPLAENEPSTSFNRSNSANRMLNFDDEDFEFTSPALGKRVSVKKSLKFTETTTNNPLKHEISDSSVSTNGSPTKLRLYTSESTTSMESGFVSELEEPFLEIEESNSPKLANITDLLSGQIKNNIVMTKKINLSRSLSFNPERASLFSIKESPEKRCRILEESETDSACKRRKEDLNNSGKIQRPILQRAFSENNASIMSALARSAIEPDLIGDFSQPFALPLISGDHSDLKSISCDTLAELIRGAYQSSISDYQVIDCRYPYEFAGGHVAGAHNLFTPAHILALVHEPLSPRKSDGKRSILVFHCEFSLERGPKLSRFLRSSDRESNKERYPALRFPEVYLLHEGYRRFYQKYPELCSPTGYTAMLDPKHRHLLRKHRSVTQPSSSAHHRRNRLLL